MALLVCLVIIMSSYHHTVNSIYVDFHRKIIIISGFMTYPGRAILKVPYTGGCSWNLQNSQAGIGLRHFIRGRSERDKIQKHIDRQTDRHLGYPCCVMNYMPGYRVILVVECEKDDMHFVLGLVEAV